MLEKMPALIFFAKIKSDPPWSRFVSLHLVTSSFPPRLGSRPQQTHGHVFQAHEQDVYFSLSTAVGSQEVHGEICCESNRIPQRRKTRKNEKPWEKKQKKGSKHVESTVETCWLDSAQAHYTEFSNWTGWIAPHIPHASPCIPVCNVSVCVCVGVCKLVHHAVRHPMLFTVRGFSGRLWVSLGVSGCLTAWRFRTKAANTQWPRKQQTQRSPKSQSPETTKRSKVKRRDAQGRRSAMTMTLWDNQIIGYPGYPIEIWPSVPKFSQIRTASDHIWCFLITYEPKSDKTIL